MTLKMYSESNAKDFMCRKEASSSGVDRQKGAETRLKVGILGLLITSTFKHLGFSKD
jgi:hypothetical protein